jgi:diaminopimelate epimerase
MQGCGNDFLFVDCLQTEAIRFRPVEVRYYCDRHFGVGADGLVVLRQSEKADFAWDFFNSDGSVAQMCGNAARCAIKYYSEKNNSVETHSFETLAGIVKGRVLPAEQVEISLLPEKNYKAQYIEQVIEVEKEPIQIFRINTGVPHAVVEVKDLSTYPIDRMGRAIQRNAVFGEEGTNVTFYQRHAGNRILSTTFERGVEAETLACGTGAAAAALIYAEQYYEPLPIHVHIPGGTLDVDLSPVSQVLLLRGPVQILFSLEVESLKGDFEPIFTYTDRKKRLP